MILTQVYTKLSGNKVECVSVENGDINSTEAIVAFMRKKVNLYPIPHICRISFLLLAGLNAYVIDYLDNLGAGKMFVNLFFFKILFI